MSLPTTQPPATRALQDRRVNEAMRRALSGERNAFDTLCRLLLPRLRPFFRRRTPDASTADDLVQETLLRVYEARSRFTREANVMPWVFTIARRLLIDRARLRRVEDVAFDPERYGCDAASEAIVESIEIARLLQRALLRLPADQRTAFELVRQEGMPVAEAAERIGTTRSAVKLRTYRATRALRAELAAIAYWGGGGCAQTPPMHRSARLQHCDAVVHGSPAFEQVFIGGGTHARMGAPVVESLPV
jgi:RNA polymerase sigma-70 factor (ECF subfamily)